uniref:Peptidase A1 domain-containing protein n=1 Tax=Bionectria ochroleuca TaxID=29856 RepID=A0A8H7KDJ4_BIOOC
MLSRFLSLAALPLTASALASPDAQNGDSGILAFPITGSVGAPIVKSLTKRQSDISLENQLLGTLYTIDVTVGTPGQTVKLQFDTGSAELWVNPICAYSDNPSLCQEAGRFTQSTSFVNLNTPGGVDYKIGKVEFIYGYDHVTIGSAKLTQQIFGVTTNSSKVSVGILGVGPSVTSWNSPYPYVLDNLASGASSTAGLSVLIFARSTTLEVCAVVFGGIDTKKFSGKLEKLPIVPAAQTPDKTVRYWVNLEGITVSLPNGQDVSVFTSGKLPVLLDSGFTLTGLPSAMFEALAKAFNANPNVAYPLVDCALINTKGTVDFKFGNTVINVPYSDFIWRPQPGTCQLGVFRSDDFPVLGDTFLRAAYVVYDWDNRNIHIANNEDCGSNLVAIGKGANAVPSLTGDCPSSNPTSSSSTSAPASTTSVSSTSTSEPPKTTSSSSSSSSASSSSSSSSSSSASSAASTSSTSRSSTQTPQSSSSSAPGTPISSASVTSTPDYLLIQLEQLDHHQHWVPDHSPVKETSTFTTTQTYTVTSCAPTVTNCPLGHVTTATITSTVYWCPATSGTFTIPQTVICTKPACQSNPTSTINHVVTVVPGPTHSVPVQIPGCTACASSVVQTTAANSPQQTKPAAWNPLPIGGVSTVTTPAVAAPTTTTIRASSVPTAGATGWNAPGPIALGLGALVAALL